jgi:hypothetical protein
MAYLSSAASTLEYGLVQVGGNIDVIDGVISISQDLSPDATVTFYSVEATTGLTLAGQSVITSIDTVAGPGISITDVDAVGPYTGFTINNTGVISLVAGPGISLSNATGNITISSYGADLINVYGTTTSYTASITDEYIGVYSASAVTVTLPAGIDGRVYTIKDEYGQGSGKITIQPQAGELVDGKNTYVIGVPYQSINTVFRAGNWWVI